MRFITFILFALAISPSIAKTISSPERQVNLLEVYTSQGCSSCPPAEKWLNKFTQDPKLFTQIIPLNFHVNYWDYLGWKDPYASPLFTKRQQEYRRLGLTNNIATPGFVLNGKGWNGWFDKRPVPLNNKAIVGQLKANINQNQAFITFTPQKAINHLMQVHIALLAFDQKTHIKRGENRGKILTYDFVVTGYKNAKLIKNQNIFEGYIELPTKKQTGKYAIAIWVSDRFNPMPIQATGDWL